MKDSKGRFNPKYYRNEWKGNQYVAPLKVSNVGRILKVSGNVLGLLSISSSWDQFNQATTIDGKIEHGLDLSLMK
jgi:hypothetical protein